MIVKDQRFIQSENQGKDLHEFVSFFSAATAMADQSDPRDITTLQEEIKENERRINDLEEEERKLQVKLKDHEENCQPKIKKLEDEIKRLKEENKTLQEKIGKLKTNMEGLETKIGDLEKRIKKFELSEDELIIRQLCSSVQENILKIVLDNYYNKIQNKSTKYIEEYITRQIKDRNDQEKAKSRWKTLKEEIKWDSFLIIQLQPVKESGNDTAHPPLTEKKINVAKLNLEQKEELSEGMVEAVDQLKNIWKQTKSKLPNGSRKRSAESRDQSSPKNGHLCKRGRWR